MKSEFRLTQHCLDTRSLLAVLMAFVVMAASRIGLAGDDQVNTRERFTKADREIQAVKQEILEINREILLLEEQLLYPQAQQLVVFVSLTADSPVTVNSISLSLDGELVSRHVYTNSEEAALHNGGIHRLYVGRLGSGRHQVEVSVTSTGSDGQQFHSHQSTEFTKLAGRKVMELQIAAIDNQTEPQFTIHEW